MQRIELTAHAGLSTALEGIVETGGPSLQNGPENKWDAGSRPPPVPADGLLREPIPVLAPAPVIMATRHVSPDIEAAAPRAGAADLVGKPLSAAQLTGQLRAQSRGRRLVEDLEHETFDLNAPPLPSTHRTPRWLIVDDDVAAIQVLQHTRLDIGDAHVDNSGAEALRLARRNEAEFQAVREHRRRIGDARVAAIVAGASDAIFSCDADGNIMLANAAAGQVFGGSSESMIGMAGLMQCDSENPLTYRQQARLAHILTSSRWLAVLLRDVLDVDRLESGKLKVDLLAVDVARCIAEAIAAVAAVAAQAGVRLKPPPTLSPIHAIAVNARLQQCLAKLLTDVTKHNRSGGRVWVEVQAELEEVAIRVRDNGLGLDETQRQHLFEPFNRPGRQRTATPRADLGLMIARQLTLAMNGHQVVESETGQGLVSLQPYLPRSNLQMRADHPPSDRDPRATGSPHD